jgi:Secretion system C-terminal sorting domain
VVGVVESPSQTFSGQMNFGNGNITTCANGPAPPQNTTADDNSTSTITVTATLPLTLIDLKSTITNCEPTLHWTTTNEINTDRFEIERCNINSLDWKKVGTLAANGNSTNNINYSFTDKNIASIDKIIYRLKMIDQDGRFTYSKILPVLVNCKSAGVLVYPNPVQDGKLYVTVAGIVGYAEANLVNISGQLIVQKKMYNGSNDLNVSNIADGVYILNIRDNNGFNKNIKVTLGRK